MKKLALILSVLATFGLTACNQGSEAEKPAEETATSSTQPGTESSGLAEMVGDTGEGAPADMNADDAENADMAESDGENGDAISEAAVEDGDAMDSEASEDSQS